MQAASSPSSTRASSGPAARSRRLAPLALAAAAAVLATLVPMVPGARAAVAAPAARAVDLPPLPSTSEPPVVHVPAGDFTNPPGATDPPPGPRPSSFDPARSEVAERQARATIYRNPDGTRTARLYGADVNWRDGDGRWHAIDDRVVDAAGGGLRNASGPSTSASAPRRVRTPRSGSRPAG